MRAAAVIALLAISGPAIACPTQAVPTTTCIEFAPITGDVEADACWTAKADLQQLAEDYTRPRTIADGPLPPLSVRYGRLQLAIDRIKRDCGQ